MIVLSCWENVEISMFRLSQKMVNTNCSNRTSRYDVLAINETKEIVLNVFGKSR